MSCRVGPSIGEPVSRPPSCQSMLRVLPSTLDQPSFRGMYQAAVPETLLTSNDLLFSDLIDSFGPLESLCGCCDDYAQIIKSPRMFGKDRITSSWWLRLRSCLIRRASRPWYKTFMTFHAGSPAGQRCSSVVDQVTPLVGPERSTTQPPDHSRMQAGFQDSVFDVDIDEDIAASAVYVG